MTIRADIKAKQHGALGSNSGRTSSTTVKVSTTLPKKMTFQEQMMMEALNAAKLSDENTGKQEGSNQLLDSEIGTSKSRINLADIVKKPKEHPSVFRIDEDHENFPTSSKVVEL